MTKLNAPRLATYLAALSLFALPACVVNEPDAPPRGVVVSGPPPAPIPETPPARPTGGGVWVTGYWHWTGMQYVWIPGHWDQPPPGRSWQKPTYSFQDGRHVYESGGWR